MFVASVTPPADLAGPGLWFCVRDGDVLVADADDASELDVEIEEPHFLGTLDGRPCWSAAVVGGDDTALLPLRSLYGRLDEPLWTLAGRAVQIVAWDRTHRFCGRCATPTEPAPGERARRCPSCGLLAYPRLSPAVIVLVERDDTMLLAHGRAFPMPMYSALAGFVEPGETLEEAVHREVREEVGIELSDVAYVGSQPWPFPNSLMIGFTARWASGDIVCDPTEIVDAAWFRPDDLPPIPPRMSIARWLIDGFLERHRP